MTTLGNVGNASVEDRAVECLAAIAYAFEDAMDDLAFLARAWEASPAASVSVAKLIATAMSEPLAGAEPADAAQPVAAVQPAVDEPAADLSVADLETATDLDAVSGSAPADESADAPADAPAGSPVAAGDEVPGVVEQVRALFAEAVTAEIPVQAAA